MTLQRVIGNTRVKEETYHFSAGGVFELDLGDSEIPLTPKQDRKQKLLEEQLEMKANETKQIQHNK